MKKILSILFVLAMSMNAVQVSAARYDIFSNPLFEVIGEITEADTAEGKIIHEYIASPEEDAMFSGNGERPEVFNYYRYSVYDSGACTKKLILSSEKALYDNINFATDKYPAYDTDVEKNEYTLSEETSEGRKLYKLTVNEDGSNEKELLYIEEAMHLENPEPDVYYVIYKVTGETKEELFENPLTFDEFYSFKDGEAEYNDGLIKVETDVTPVFNDVDGNMIYADAYTTGLTYYYNLGYFAEVTHNFNELASGDAEYQIFYTDIFNAFTDEEFSFENAEIRGFLDNGYAILSTAKSAEETIDYLIKLRKPAIITVLLDDAKIKFDQLPVIDNGRTLVPLRAIFDALGAEVSWDKDTQTVTAVKGDTEVKLTINDTTAYKNNEEITLDVPAKIISGRTMVPARFVADCFDVDVAWDDVLKQVILTSK